jgi:ABC-type branched-subunit amino acid transport system ATPase component
LRVDPVYNEQVDVPILAAQGLNVAYGGVVAVNNVSMTLNSGTITGLIGPNGAGKSTALNCLSGVIRPKGARITMLGRDVTSWNVSARARAGMGRTFQHIRLFPSLTAAENIEVAIMGSAVLALAGGRRRRLTPPGISVRATALDALRRLGLADVADRGVQTLTPGQRRLVEIARLIAMDVRLMLLDEPSSGLNVSEASDLYSVIAELRTEGRAVLVVEHRLKTVTKVADRMVVMDRGSVIADGTTKQVMANPQVQQAYLGGNAADA